MNSIKLKDCTTSIKGTTCESNLTYVNIDEISSVNFVEINNNIGLVTFYMKNGNEILANMSKKRLSMIMNSI